MIADYNGWTDLPGAERGALDILEHSSPVPSERLEACTSRCVGHVTGPQC